MISRHLQNAVTCSPAGGGSKKLGASSYLLELVPDNQVRELSWLAWPAGCNGCCVVQQGSDMYRHHRMHVEGFPAHYHATSKQDDAAFRHHGNAFNVMPLNEAFVMTGAPVHFH